MRAGGYPSRKPICEALLYESIPPDWSLEKENFHEAGRPLGKGLRRDVALPAAPEQRAAQQARYLGDSAVKLPPSAAILQNRTPLTKGAEEAPRAQKSP